MKHKFHNAYMGIAAAITFIILFVAALFLYNGYSIFTNYLSDLGVNSSTSFLFNNSLIITGFLGFLFSIGLSRMFQKEKMGYVGSLLFMVACISLTLVGVFPSSYNFLHSLFAGIFFTLAAVSLILIGLQMRNYSKNLGILSVAAGVPPLVFILTVVPFTEHIAVFSILAWTIIFCVSIAKIE